MDREKQPGISFNTIFLKELNFRRKPEINGAELNLNFNSVASFSEDKKQLVYELACKVTDKSETFHIDCVMVGIFTSIEGGENMDLLEFSKVNAPALMFPYIRELVTTTSIKAGLAPIVFPPINVSSLLSSK